MDERKENGVAGRMAEQVRVARRRAGVEERGRAALAQASRGALRVLRGGALQRARLDPRVVPAQKPYAERRSEDERECDGFPPRTSRPRGCAFSLVAHLAEGRIFRAARA